MTEFPGVPWLKIVSNFLWIFGAALILAIISYHVFLHRWKKKCSSFFRIPLKKTLILGSILILTGGCLSLVLTMAIPAEAPLVADNTLEIEPAKMMGKKDIKKDYIIMSENGHLSTQKIHFEKGTYLVHIVTWGAAVQGETARLKIYIGLYLIADFFVPTQFEEQTFLFKSLKKENRRLRIEFLNDYFNPEKKLNRNASIQTISIKRQGTLPITSEEEKIQPPH
ncbi:MAG: hypothetical protein JXB26_17810 [Candidatus Aminicenantes bacterium]|nr:hypothetical protein [Candidatus Aminicenantes bacterium]